MRESINQASASGNVWEVYTKGESRREVWCLSEQENAFSEPGSIASIAIEEVTKGRNLQNQERVGSAYLLAIHRQCLASGKGGSPYNWLLTSSSPSNFCLTTQLFE